MPEMFFIIFNDHEFEDIVAEKKAISGVCWVKHILNCGKSIP